MRKRTWSESLAARLAARLAAPIIVLLFAPARPGALQEALQAAARDASGAGLGAIPISGRERGLADVDGELWAVGATYKARFDAGGVLIVPPLGADAPRSLPLRLSLESIALGGRELLAADGLAAPRQGHFGDFDVRYEHGGLVTERYEVRSEHLEQTFTLHELPAERGELVVRLAVDTELVGRADGQGLFFEGAPGRGLHYGALTAIDARGERAVGDVRLASGVLELVVPADFLATAEAPLLLDPAIGGKIDVSPGSGDFRDPDVTSGVGASFFAVYERHWSATDLDVYGQEFTFTGALIGPTVVFEPTIATVAQEPTAAVSLSAGMFSSSIDAHVAFWQQGSSVTGTQSIAVRASLPVSGALCPSAIVASGAGSHTKPDAARTTLPLGVFGTSVVVVWQQNTEIRSRYLQVSSGVAPPTLGTQLPLSSGLLDTNPSVGSGNGSSNLVVWERWFSTPAPGDHDLVGAVIENGSAVISLPSVFVQTTIGPDELHPRVGSGMLVYDRKASLGAPERDIYRIAFNEHDTLSPLEMDAPILVGPSSGSDDHHPAISTASLSQSMRIAWVNGGPPVIGEGLLGNVANGVTLLNTSCFVPLFCIPEWLVCENVHPVAGISGGPFSSEEIEDVALAPGMVVYESVGVGIFAQALTFPFTTVSVSLGGGCAGGGTAGNECPAAINSNLVHLLTGATPSQSAVLILGFDRIDSGCGSCTLVPDPFTGFVLAAGSTDALGEAKVPMPIPDSPALMGLTFIDQWAVIPGTGACPALGVSLSEARQFTIQ